MKGAGGMRGMFVAIAKALSTRGFGAPIKSGIMDRAPGFMGVGPKVHRCLQSYSRNSKKPHQGAKECARRRRQMRTGQLRYSNSGHIKPFVTAVDNPAFMH